MTARVAAPEIDIPEVVAEVAAAFERYERALADGDLDVLDELFWDSPATVRFGIADHQWGADAVRRWRVAHGRVPPGRALRRTEITTFGTGTAVVTTLFGYPGRPVTGRQSQTWVRLPEGWRVVSAHVSVLPGDSDLQGLRPADGSAGAPLTGPSRCGPGPASSAGLSRPASQDRS
jgi:hypothetical protein